MSDVYSHRINRNAFIAALFSLLAHALALFLLSRQDLFTQHQSDVQRPETISVRLSPSPAQKKPIEAIPPPRIVPKPPAPPAPVARKSRIQPSPDIRTEPPEVIAAIEADSPISLPPATDPVPASDKPATALDPSQFPDMAAYVKAARERRGVSGEGSDQDSGEAAAQAQALSEDEARMANIRRNLQQPGTNGVFRITRMDTYTATFSFRGWKAEYSYSNPEVYQVDVEMSGNIQRAVVRKMVEIIRRYYNGDFNWQSLRLGRVVVLSARLQDNDGLEDFLMREFFAGY